MNLRLANFSRQRLSDSFHSFFLVLKRHFLLGMCLIFRNLWWMPSTKQIAWAVHILSISLFLSIGIRPTSLNYKHLNAGIVILFWDATAPNAMEPWFMTQLSKIIQFSNMLKFLFFGWKIGLKREKTEVSQDLRALSKIKGI